MQNRVEAFDEWRKCSLDVYEDLPFFNAYLKENYTEYAISKIRYNTAIGMNNWKIHKFDEKTNVFIVTHKQSKLIDLDSSFI